MDWNDLAVERYRWRAVVTAERTVRVPYNVGNFLTEELLASQEGLCSMEVVS
jgi:hypothetical protein